MPTVVHQLALNENNSPPLPGVRAAIEGSIETIAFTLDVKATGLAERIAELVGVPAANVLAGAGSSALLQQFLFAHSGPGRTVVHGCPTFLYPSLIRNAGAESVSAGDLAEAVDERTSVVLVCNPDNPTGEVLGHEALKTLLAKLPPHVLLLVDEAYREFADQTALADALALAARDDRVAVVRTFSKSHGLLGLRVGYLVGAERVLAPLRRTSAFFRVSTVAQAAALAALDAEDEMRARCAQIAAERDRVRARLLDLGWDVPPSGGNFLWVPLGERNTEFVEFLGGHGVAVREIAGAGVRVSTGTPAANDALLLLAEEFAR
jgi:histidinol-phosphate aminotransferase